MLNPFLRWRNSSIRRKSPLEESGDKSDSKPDLTGLSQIEPAEQKPVQTSSEQESADSLPEEKVEEEGKACVIQ